MKIVVHDTKNVIPLSQIPVGRVARISEGGYKDAVVYRASSSFLVSLGWPAGGGELLWNNPSVAITLCELLPEGTKIELTV